MLEDLIYNKAISFLNSGKIKDSIDYFEKDLEINPGITRSLFHLGKLYNTIENWLKCKEIFQKLVKLTPTDENYYKLGNAHSKLGETIFAVDSYKLSLELNENYLLSHLALADLFGRSGNDYKMEYYLKNVITINSSHQPTYLKLIALQIKHFRYDEAYELIQKYYNLFPNDLKIRVTEVELLIRMGKFNSAKSCLDDLLENDEKIKKALSDKLLLKNKKIITDLISEKLKKYRETLNYIEPNPKISEELSLLFLLNGNIKESTKFLIFSRQIRERINMKGKES
jgi:tetratricopeptide (TPR) repeat protein